MPVATVNTDTTVNPRDARFVVHLPYVQVRSRWRYARGGDRGGGGGIE